LAGLVVAGDAGGLPRHGQRPLVHARSPPTARRRLGRPDDAWHPHTGSSAAVRPPGPAEASFPSTETSDGTGTAAGARTDRVPARLPLTAGPVPRSTRQHLPGGRRAWFDPAVTRRWLLSVGLVVALVGPTPTPAVASGATVPGRAFDFGAIGDTRFTADEQARFPNLVEDMNAAGLAFSVHDGNIGAD